MVAPIWIVGFSGHRPKNETCRQLEDLESCRPRISEALLRFQEIAKNAGGEIHFHSGVAEGADTIAIEVAHELGIAVHVILPMSAGRFADDFDSSPEQWDRALSIVAMAGGLARLDADQVDALCKRGAGKFQTASELPVRQSKWTLRVSSGTRERPMCYHECGEEMLQSCDGLIAVHCQATDKLGGTTEVIKQATSNGQHVATIDPLGDNVEWSSANAEWKRDEICSELHHICDSDTKDQPEDEHRGFLDAELARYNRISMKNGNWFRNTLLIGVGLHFVASTIAIASISFHWGWPATALEWILVLTAILIGVWSHKYVHEHWRQTRFAAEVLRGLSQSCVFLDPIKPLVSHHHPAWHRFALSYSLHDPNCESGDAVTDLKRYRKDRIENQLQYFRAKLKPATFWGTLCKKLSKFSALFALAAISTALILKCYPQKDPGETSQNQSAKVNAETEHQHPPAQSSHGGKSHKENNLPLTWAKFLSAFLPLTAGLAMSLVMVTDYGRRKERYSIMTKRLEELSFQFASVKSPHSARSAVRRCEEILLDELIEWYASNKEIMH